MWVENKPHKATKHQRALSITSTWGRISIRSQATFEEDKFPIIPLVGCVDVGRQSLPEMADGHRVTCQYLVVPHAPKPLILKPKEPMRNPVLGLQPTNAGSRCSSRTLNTNFSPLRIAMVSKCPSQMSGPCSGRGNFVGRGGGGGGGGPDLLPE